MVELGAEVSVAEEVMEVITEVTEAGMVETGVKDTTEAMHHLHREAREAESAWRNSTFPSLL